MRPRAGLCRLHPVLGVPVGASDEPARSAGAGGSALRMARAAARSVRRLCAQRAHRMKRRCAWARNPLAIAYHDKEWGVPVRNDRKLFEFLILEGAQAGLSWDTILAKRANYRRAFHGFDAAKIARYGARDRKRLLADVGIVRNRAKVDAAITHARCLLAVQKGYGRFSQYAWGM